MRILRTASQCKGAQQGSHREDPVIKRFDCRSIRVHYHSIGPFRVILHLSPTECAHLRHPMPTSEDQSLTALLDAWRSGDGSAYSGMFELAYSELKRIAAARLGAGARSGTLSPTELVHEAALRVMEGGMQWNNRAHFFASLSLYMRAVLVDRARARMSKKRGGEMLRVTLADSEVVGESGIADLLALDKALNELEALDARSSAVLHLTYFAGLDRKQIAEVLGVSIPTVDREIRFAKTWLNKHIESQI